MKSMGEVNIWRVQGKRLKRKICREERVRRIPREILLLTKQDNKIIQRDKVLMFREYQVEIEANQENRLKKEWVI